MFNARVFDAQLIVLSAMVVSFRASIRKLVALFLQRLGEARNFIASFCRLLPGVLALAAQVQVVRSSFLKVFLQVGDVVFQQGDVVLRVALC